MPTITVHPEIYRLQGKLKMWKGELIRVNNLLNDEWWAVEEERLQNQIAKAQADLANAHEHRANAPKRIAKMNENIERDERIIVAMETNPAVIPLISYARRIKEMENELAHPCD